MGIENIDILKADASARPNTRRSNADDTGPVALPERARRSGQPEGEGMRVLRMRVPDQQPDPEGGASEEAGT